MLAAYQKALRQNQPGIEHQHFCFLKQSLEKVFKNE